MFHDICATEIKPVMRGGRNHMPDDVWLSKNIEKDVLENRIGDEVTTQDVWTADRVHIVTDLSDDEIVSQFDLLWEQAELDEKSTRELTIEGREANDDTDLAVADLSETVSDNAISLTDLADAVAELSQMVSDLKSKE